jgi:hypothetical protein
MFGCVNVKSVMMGPLEMAECGLNEVGRFQKIDKERND